MPIIANLDDFAYVSGLRINQAKSMVIELDPRGSEQPIRTFGLTKQTPGDTCKYLGVLVRQRVSVDENWNMYTRAL